MTRSVLIVSAFIAWGLAAMLLFAPRRFEAPVGIDLTEKAATIAQAQGALLAGIGLINWLSRSVTDTRALRAVLTGNLLVQLISFIVVARAILIGLFPSGGAGALIIHLALGLAFVLALRETRGP
jgi:hypothetical protein